MALRPAEPCRITVTAAELPGAKVVTAVDDHSRSCVIANAAERAASRIVCLVLAEALARFVHVHGSARK